MFIHNLTSEKHNRRNEFHIDVESENLKFYALQNDFAVSELKIPSRYNNQLMLNIFEDKQVYTLKGLSSRAPGVLNFAIFNGGKLSAKIIYSFEYGKHESYEQSQSQSLVIAIIVYGIGFIVASFFIGSLIGMMLLKTQTHLA